MPCSKRGSRLAGMQQLENHEWDVVMNPEY
jgi:hypothetical protein